MKKTLILSLLTLAAIPLAAQDLDTSHFRMSISTGVSVSGGFGRTLPYSWVAPSFELHPTNRLTVNAGFANIGSLMPSDYKLHGYFPADLSPRRTGTQATALWTEAQYRVGNRLSIWGAIAHIGGFAQPLWLDHSMPLQATAISGGFDYRFAGGSLLEMHFTYIRDTYGTLTPLLYTDPFTPYKLF